MAEIKKWESVFASTENRSRYHAELEAIERKLHAFLSLAPAERGRVNDGPLSGLPFGVKDNIAVEGAPLTCGSRGLEGFISPYSATAVERLVEAGAVPVGKTNLDEFGMGSSSDYSAFAETNNPWDLTRVAGGSSGGSAVAVASGEVPFALGSDTGGSVRLPAAFCGVYGLKPTYGAVSRYGLVAYASSLDVIGVLSRNLGLLSRVFSIIRGRDFRDSSSVHYPEEDQKGPAPLSRASTIGVLKAPSGLSPPVEESYTEAVECLRDSGHSIVYVELDSMDYCVPAYYTIATAEASANLARYNGIRYGVPGEESPDPDSLVRSSRKNGFGSEVKMRVLLGTYVLRSGYQERYYIRAQKIRTLLKEELARKFERVDLIMLPPYPVQAFPHGVDGLTPFQQKVADLYNTIANLTGSPALSVPTGLKKGLPVAVQFCAPPFGEARLFRLAERLAEFFPLPKPNEFLGYHLEGES